MRQIKFRAWDKEKEKMFVPVRLTFIKGIAGVTHAIGDRDVNPKSNDYVVMQFTGLLDKNGKEIYEGDVLKGKLSYSNDDGSDAGSEETIGKVEWDRIGWYCRVTDFYNAPSNAEVIGNIYENPELLTSDKEE